MAETGTLHDAFIDELRDVLRRRAATDQGARETGEDGDGRPLRDAFESHLQETQGQIERLEQVFESLEEKVRGKHCEGIAGIIEEGKAIMEEDFDEATMDACLIAAGQRAEDYEMAAYGTLIAWARAMGHDEAADLLEQNLDEEKAADEKLSGLAEGGINQSAADAAHPDERTGRRRSERREKGFREGESWSPLTEPELDKVYGPIHEIEIAMLTMCRPDGHLESRRWRTRSAWTVWTCGSSPLRAREAARYRSRSHVNLRACSEARTSGCRHRVSRACRGTARISASSTSPIGKDGLGRRGIRATARPTIPGSSSSASTSMAAVFLEAKKPKPIVLSSCEGGSQASERSLGRHTSWNSRIVSRVRRDSDAALAICDRRPAASRNPATNAAWSRRALGPRPQDLAYTRFLTRGEDTETLYRPPAQRTSNARMSRPRRRIQLSNGRGVSNRLVFIREFVWRGGADNIVAEAAVCDQGEHQ